MAVPTLIQHISFGANPAGNGITGRAFVFTMPNAVGASNCLICCVSALSGITVTISDNNGNTWSGTPAGSVDAGGGAMKSWVFVLPNANAGITTITVGVGGSNTLPVEIKCSEYDNIATSSPVNGTATLNGGTGPSLSTGTFSPGNNDANGGNLVFVYWAMADTYSGSSAGVPSSFVPGGSFALLDADLGNSGGVQGYQSASMAYIQATSASITPGITATSDSSNGYNGVAVALKAASAGTAAQSFQINKILHSTTFGGSTTNPFKLHMPVTGNLRVLTTANFYGLTPITSVTDSDGNTWISLSNSPYNLPSDCPQIFWCANQSANTNLIVSVHGTFSVTQSIRLFDIQGADASPYDTYASVGSTTASSVTHVSNQPDITPTATNGIVIANGGLGQGPGTGFYTGAPSGAVFDLINYTGETDQDLIDNADLLGHVYYSSNAAQTWNWTITSNAGNSVFSTAISFKAGNSSGSGSALAWPVRA